ncbi:MAG: BatA domain-containing protein [Planctomycetota bacterium]|nr:BatA domain-containing protein [Planctomycetota bacterium]
MTHLAGLLTWQLFAMGGALAAVPILIHLLNRRRVRRVEWAAMQWLLAALKRHQRRLRLENWLILLLRVAAIVLLGLALARPVLTEGAGLLARQKRSIYLVLDNSYSTEAKLDSRAVIDRVRHEAELVLGSVGPDDATVVIVTNDPDEDASPGLSPHVLVGRTVGGEGAVRAREAVAALRTRAASAHWARAFQAVHEQMTDEDVNRHVVVVTDLQAKDWLTRGPEAIEGDLPPRDPAAPVDTSTDRLRRDLIAVLRRPASVTIVDVGGRDRRDLAVLSVENRGGQDPFVGRSLRLAVTVANYGTTPVAGAQLAIRVDEGDRRVNFTVPDLPAASIGLRVPAPGLATVQVDLPRSTFREAGSHVLQLLVTPPRDDPGADMLARSSERWLALHVRRRVNVLAWTATSEDEHQMNAADYLRAIYEGDVADSGTSMADGPPPIYQYEAAHGESALRSRLEARADRPIDMLVLANVAPRDTRLLAEMRSFVRDGGGLLVFTGHRADSEALNDAFGARDNEPALLPRRFARAQARERNDPTAGHFSIDLAFQEKPHPLAEPFTNVRADDWIKRVPPKLWGRTAFEEPKADAAPDTEDAAEVVLRFRPEPGFEQGPPFVIAGKYGEGRTVWVGTSVDNGWLDRSVLFLPVFLEEAAMYVTRPGDAGRNLPIGGVLRVSIPVVAEQVRVVPPGAGAVSPQQRTSSDEEATRVEHDYDVIGRTGVWAVTYELPGLAGGENVKMRDLFAVNADPTEGQLIAAAHDAVRAGIPEELDLRFLTSYDDEEEDIREAREGELTTFLLYLLLAILLLESFLAGRFGRRGQFADEGGAA